VQPGAAAVEVRIVLLATIEQHDDVRRSGCGSERRRAIVCVIVFGPDKQSAWVRDVVERAGNAGCEGVRHITEWFQGNAGWQTGRGYIGEATSVKTVIRAFVDFCCLD